MGRKLKWSTEDLLQVSKQYTRRSDFKAEKNKYYEAARRRGILDQICKHMTKRDKKWSTEKILQEALKYDDRTAFQKACPGAYFGAAISGILEEACAHIPRKKKQSKWTESAIKEEAKKYSTRSDFIKGAGRAYVEAKKRGLLDSVCTHMRAKKVSKKN